MIVRRCPALMILACSLCLVVADGKTNFRGMALPERRLKEEGAAKDAVPPTKKKTTKTKVKKSTDTPAGPETTLVKPIATPTKTAKTGEATTTKTAAPTVATTETEKTEPAVDDNVKESTSQPNETEQGDEQEGEPEEEAASKSPQDEEASPEEEAAPVGEGAAPKGKDSPEDEENSDKSIDEKQPDDEGQLKSKEDEPDGSAAPTPDATSDLCVNATTCLECEKAATNSSLHEEKTCVWKDSACKLVAKEDPPSDSKCDDNETATHKVTTPVKDDEEGGSFVPGLVVIVVVFGLLALRSYMMNHDITIPGVGGGIPGAFRQQRSSSLQSSRHAETVPLAGSDDDEWGWDDSGGDVELPAGRTKQKEKEDLEMAMALSLSESPIAPMTSKAGARMAPYPTRRSNSGARTTPPSSGGDWDDWDDESPSSPRVTSATPPAAIPKIASLGVRQPVATRPKVAEKPKEDDIFASMGLAAKPKFSHRPANAPASGARTAASPTPAPFTSTLSAAAAGVGEDVGEDWDDDSDLDDLLDE